MLAASAIVYFVLVVTFHGGLANRHSFLYTINDNMYIGRIVCSHETKSISTMMGTLMLIGIIVTNAIVLVNRVIRNEESGFSTREALLKLAQLHFFQP